jgi:type IV pilus assembly protein PilC
MRPKASARPPDRFLARARIAPRHQIQFFRQMEMLLSSGILIVEALARLRDRYPDRRTRQVLAVVHAQVAASRSSLSRALAFFPRSFPPGIVTVVAAGEESGTAKLAERFADLAERIAYTQANRREVRNACAYPALVLLLAAGFYLLLLTVVFPRLAEVLASLGTRLPPLTRAVIAASGLARRDWPLLAAILVVLPLLLAALRRMPAAVRPLDRCFLRLPLVGGIYRDLTVALVCKVYRSLYQANKPSPEILGLCAQLTGNACFRDGLREAGAKLAAGRASLAEAFTQSGLFPPLACLAIDVGEQSGQLAQAMERVSVYYGEQARERIGVAIAVLNPALTLAVVGGVGVALLSFFQAIYQVVYAVH